MNSDIISILKTKLADSETEVKHLRTVCAELQAELDRVKPLALKNTGPRTAVYPDWDLVNRHVGKVVKNLLHPDFKTKLHDALVELAATDDPSELMLMLTDSARDLAHRGNI